MRLSRLLRLIETETDCSVNLQVIHPLFLSEERFRLDADQYIHSSSFCREIKLGKAFSICLANKKRSIAKAQKGKPFVGICPNGMWDMVHPVFYKNELISILYVGKHGGVRKDVQRSIREWGFFVERFICAELKILEAEKPRLLVRRSKQDIHTQVSNYINQNYTDDISLAEFAMFLKLNPNHLSQRIRQATGKTFRRLLSEKRVAEALTYLKLQKSIDISQIARLCGFSDSNYFSTVFKKIVGCAPITYRAKNL